MMMQTQRKVTGSDVKEVQQVVEAPNKVGVLARKGKAEKKKKKKEDKDDARWRSLVVD